MLAALCWPAANVEAQCAPPTNFTVSNVTETSARLTWTASSSSNVNYYELSRSTVEVTDFNQYPDFWDWQGGTSSSHNVMTFDWTDLNPGTTYYCYLHTLCTDYSTSEYVSLSFTTLPGCKRPVVTFSKQLFCPDAIYFDFTNPNFVAGDNYTLQIAYGLNETFDLNNPSTYTIGFYDNVTEATHQNGFIYDNNYVQPNTKYSLATRVSCSDGVETTWSPWTKPVEIRTACDGVALPYAEDFDSYTQGVSTSQNCEFSFSLLSLPECWNFLNLSESRYTKPMAFLTSSSSLAKSGNALLMYSSLETPVYALLPTFIGTANQPLELSFHYAYMTNSTSYSGTLSVGYITSLNGEYFDSSNFVELYSCQVTDQMTLSSETINSLPANARLAFRFTAAKEYNGVVIDEVEVMPGGICAPVVVDATHPYTDDFEGDQCWQLVNDTNTNAWALGHPNSSMLIGAIYDNGGINALYISNDNGTSTSYSNDIPSVVYATKLFSLSAGEYAVRYDWHVFGEGDNDYLRAALVPASVELAASTTPPTGLTATTLPDGWIALDGGVKKNACYYLDFSTFETDGITVTESGFYKVVFVWCNNASEGSAMGAVVDDFTLSMTPCPKPYNLTTRNITNSEANVYYSVSAGTGSYTYILDKSEDFDITDSTKYVNTSSEGISYLYDLEANTSYTFAIRANCDGGGYSAWAGPVSFMTMPSCGEEPAITFTIGDQTNKTTQIPYYCINSASYDYAASWQIFTPEEILNGATFAGDITSLAWKNDRDVTHSFQIFMCNTDKTSFDSATDTIARSTMTKVYEGSTHFTHDVWSKVEFDTPFAYDGTHNLLVMVNRTQGMWSTSTSQFEYSTADDNKTIAGYGYQGLTNLVRTTKRNNTRFTMCANEDECTYMNLPYFENFNAYTASDNHMVTTSLPYCWNRLNTGSFNNILPYIFTSAVPGDNQLGFLCSSDSGSTDQIAILPQVDISSHPMNTLQITFGARNQFNIYPFKLVVGIMSDPTDITTFVPVDSISPSSVYNFTNFTVPFSDYTGSGSYIALMAPKPETNYNQGWVDNVRVEVHSCFPITVDASHPYTEDFDSYEGNSSPMTDSNNLPDCWYHLNAGNNMFYSGFPIIYDNSFYASSGNNSLYFSTKATDTSFDDQIAILPQIDIMTHPINTLQLSFDARSDGAYMFTAVVGIISNPTDKTTFVPVGSISTKSSSYKHYEFPFSQYTGSGSFIAIMAPMPTTSYNAGYIDNIVVDVLPACITPMDVNASNITPNSITFSWAEMGTATAWDIEYGPAGFTHGNGTMVTVTSNSYTATGLTPSTGYDFYVRANCGDGNVSNYTNRLNTSTECLPLSLPYAENFDAYDANASFVMENLPYCWSRINTGSNIVGLPNIYSNAYGAASGKNSLQFFTSASVYCDDQYAVLPQIDVSSYPMNTVQLSLDARSKYTDISGYTFKLMVGVMTDPTDRTTFEIVDSIVPESTTYITYTVPFSSYTGTGSYIALMVKKPTSGSNYGNIDNLAVSSNLVPCAPVVVDVTHPYTDDFETDQCWQLINNTLTNAWTWGTATNNGGDKALYISNDGGTTNTYTITSPSMVYSTKLFTLSAGEYTVNYDWKATGESNWDFLRVALVPSSETLTAGTLKPDGFDRNSLPAGWIAMDGGAQLNQSSNWTTFEDIITVPENGEDVVRSYGGVCLV